MEQMRFSAPEPYPKIEVTRHDIPFAKKLLSAYAAEQSEMSATTSYYYRSAVLATRNPRLSFIMLSLARVEQTHLNILARLIFLLGYDPKYRAMQNESPLFWDGGCLSYKKDPQSILREAIEEETGAEKAYIELSSQTNDPKVSRMLARLSLDEKLHTELLKNEHEILKKSAVRL